jgi:prevent-host-death family protein
MPATLPESHPFDEFREDPTAILDQLRTTHRPITLTVHGQSELVIQEAAEYDRMLELVETADVRDAIRRGLEDVEAGRTRPADAFFEEMRQKYAIPR